MRRLSLKSMSNFVQVDYFVRSLIDHPVRLSWVVGNLNLLYKEFCKYYDDDYEYSETIYAFFNTTFTIVGDIDSEKVVWNESLAEEFIRLISFYRSQIEQEEVKHIQQETDNQKALVSDMKKLTSHYSRLLFVRVDLWYNKSKLDEVSLEEFNEHKDKLCQLLWNKKSCFKGLKYFCWAVEVGWDKSFHIHLLLVYDSSLRRNGFEIGKSVCEKWEKITNHKGDSWNCNNTKYMQKWKNIGILGIGVIERKNPREVENAIQTASYLAKPSKIEQRLIVKLPKMRSFGKSQYKIKERKTKAKDMDL